jgi:hypothetical protein
MMKLVLGLLQAGLPLVRCWVGLERKLRAATCMQLPYVLRSSCFVAFPLLFVQAGLPLVRCWAGLARKHRVATCLLMHDMLRSCCVFSAGWFASGALLLGGFGKEAQGGNLLAITHSAALKLRCCFSFVVSAGWFTSGALLGGFGKEAQGGNTGSAAAAAAKTWALGVPLGIVIRSISR